MRSSLFGISFNSKASVESQIRGSSCGINGSSMGREPTAKMACSKFTEVVSSPSTWIWLGPVNFPFPLITWHFLILAMPPRPSVSFPMTCSFHWRTFAMSISGSPKVTPCSSMAFASLITLARCKRALEGMHPTFKQTPPSEA